MGDATWFPSQMARRRTVKCICGWQKAHQCDMINRGQILETFGDRETFHKNINSNVRGPVSGIVGVSRCRELPGAVLQFRTGPTKPEQFRWYLPRL